MSESPPSLAADGLRTSSSSSAKRLDLVDHAVERGGVSKECAEHGVRPGLVRPQLREGLEQWRHDRTPNADLVKPRRHASRFAPRLMTAHHKVLVRSAVRA